MRTKATRGNIYLPRKQQLLEAVEMIKFVRGYTPAEITAQAESWERGAHLLRIHAAHLKGFAIPPVSLSTMSNVCQQS